MIAFITELAVVRKILEHLGLPAGTPPLASARLPRALAFDFEADDHRGTETDEAEPASVPRGRGPPRLPSDVTAAPLGWRSFVLPVVR